MFPIRVIFPRGDWRHIVGDVYVLSTPTKSAYQQLLEWLKRANG
jgi:hypothetical protein